MTLNLNFNLSVKQVLSVIFRLLIIGIACLFLLFIYLDSKVRYEFDQQAWDIPAKVYARPLSFSLGKPLKYVDLIEELELLGYRKSIKAVVSGEYEHYQQTFVIHTRPFKFWDGKQDGQIIQLSIKNDQISSLKNFESMKNINFLRLDPLSLGSIQIKPDIAAQDRQLVQLKDLPKSLIPSLLAIEDRGFYSHWGISLKGIARALWSNITQGEVRQGGSTITQQLMKNHFLSNERSLVRKGKEAIMAILTEYHYDKDTIIQAYINEVYFGQNRSGAIHGFARASEFFFDKNISRLSLPEVALLVGMIKGPSFYNPRKNPERALKRRNLVLRLMFEQGVIDEENHLFSQSKNLMVVKQAPIKTSKVPAFMGLIKKELSSEYSGSSLRKDGLKLFTTLDPIIQRKAEKALQQQLAKLDSKNVLQGSIILTDIATGEIQAVVGDRQPNYVGFNRAVDAYRQTGSIIKPFVYLTALQKAEYFNLLTKIEDKAFSLKGPDGKYWTPKNSDGKEHGDKNSLIPLGEGLVNSYNLATVQLALKVGIDNIVDTIIEMGFERDLPAFPSIALGSKEMSLLEVTRLYQALANNGASVKPLALLAVQDQQGNLLKGYVNKSEQVVDKEAAFIVRYLLSQVAKRGTARSLSRLFPDVVLAGKTGTTNDLKDSWFVGFDNDKLAVVWVGRDDNKPMGLYGSNGALLVWAELFKQLKISSLDLTPPKGVVMGYKESGFFSRFRSCNGYELTPFYQSALPKEYKVCD